jgi:hypothetical protein
MEEAMVGKKWKWTLGMVVLFCCLCAAPVYGGLYWEAEQVTEGMPGQADHTRMVKNYFSEDASRVERGPNQIVITDFDEMILYELNPADKSYKKMDLKEMGKLPSIPEAEGGGEQASQMQARMQAMMKKMAGGMQVAPTDETKTINGYKCTKYVVRSMMTESEHWLSKDVEGYDELKAIGKKMGEAFDENPMLKQMNIAGMIAELEGFPVRTVTRVMNGKVVTTLKKIEQKPLDDKLVEMPEGYKQK